MGNTLIETKEYLRTGSHIGTKFKTAGMRKYIFKKRPDKLKVFDVSVIDEKLSVAAKFLSSFEPSEIVVVSKKQYGQKPAEMFAQAIGAKSVVGRFSPGTFTNPAFKHFLEPAIILVTDPGADGQAINEANNARVPIIAMCSTDNETKNIDLIIPINNKGRQSLALAYWLLAREFLKIKGAIKSDADFKYKVSDFEFVLEKGSREEMSQEFSEDNKRTYEER
ncbi:MAG: 30S ribosomal protein S2 [Candidatus Diapherotrites archaeon CG08_land_8_20_14_0_20_34_12]|nr:MAG: 30S ribosomal protein S2 [Candidatus Diapherotrites archaeon CG08_land_8_20_14_0_20_34_12]